MGSLSELGIYIHLPFCKQKCAYCDFNSYAGLDGLQDGYVNALVKEIEEAAKRNDIVGREIVSIYFGGGTPTIMGVGSLDRLVEVVKRHFSSGANAEITVEANPETLTLEKLKALQEPGVNRLSLGFQ